ATGEPLKSARIVLVDPEHNDPAQGLTDSSGHFVIAGVPAGIYHFRASKVGYVEQSYRPNGGDGSTQLLALEPGEKLDKVLFRLNRAGVISGRITDENGEPAADVLVEALVPTNAMTFGPGSRFPMDRAQYAVTNDLGEYRLFDLPPGRYFVAVTDSDVA